MSLTYSYEGSLEAAGAKVLAFSEFGDYQGSWYAKVEYEGKTGWISGSYGSCSGCDAFQSEFDNIFDEETEHPSRLVKFGKSYLGNLMSTEELLKEVKDNTWDLEDEELQKFIKDNT